MDSIFTGKKPIGTVSQFLLNELTGGQVRLVILDEPTLGQDWRHLQQLMDFLVWLNRQGTAILLITHDYKLVYRYAQRVILMDAGRISLDGHINLDAQKDMPTATHAEVNYVAP